MVRIHQKHLNTAHNDVYLTRSRVCETAQTSPPHTHTHLSRATYTIVIHLPKGSTLALSHMSKVLIDTPCMKHMQKDLAMGGHAEHHLHRLRCTCEHRPWHDLIARLSAQLHQPPKRPATQRWSSTSYSSRPANSLQHERQMSGQ